MIGGIGNDTYYVNNVGDIIVENTAEGTDLVYISTSYTMAENIENGTISTGSTANLTGNSLANILTGGGGSGYDTYVVDALDTITELSGGGTDTVQADFTYTLGTNLEIVDSGSDSLTEGSGSGNDLVRSSVTRTLGSNFENLTLTGSSAINATGNTLDNILPGTAATTP